jgi:hypothetical protein
LSGLNFLDYGASKPFVSAKASIENTEKRRTSSGSQPEEKSASKQISFGPRRLFIPPRPLMSPMFEPDDQRPRAILRLRSTCS